MFTVTVYKLYSQQAIMTFEEDKLSQAMKALQETEKKCEASDGFVTSQNAKKKDAQVNKIK